MIYSSILDTVGNTPLVRIRNLAPEHSTIYAKCEYFNPLGSVKDRLALAMLSDARASGQLRSGQTVVEATSGNTGIGLAMACAAWGYPFVAVMSDRFSVECRKIIRYLGGRVVLTPAADGGTGMLRKAEELAEEHGWFLTRQFENPVNHAYHRRTTGAEILSDLAYRRLDYFVSGWGTGGTLTGAGDIIKRARPEVGIIGAEPDKAALLSGKSHSPHEIQGWAPNFLPEVLDPSVVDRVVTVTGPDAIASARALASREGIFCGISGGATFAAAKIVAEEAPQGTVIVCILPDTAERYLSTALFDGISDQGDDL